MMTGTEAGRKKIIQPVRISRIPGLPAEQWWGIP